MFLFAVDQVFLGVLLEKLVEERDSISVFSWDGKVDGRLLLVWRIVWDELFQNMREMRKKFRMGL